MISYEKNLLEFGRQLSFKKLAFYFLEKLAGAKPDGVVVCGMGGSGIPGTILKKLAGELGIPVPTVSVRDRTLPRLFFKKPLFIFVSFSGETAETIANLKSALAYKSGADVAIVTAGGKLKSIAQEKRLPLVTFHPENLTSREASGTMFYGLIKILKVILPVKVSSFESLNANKFKGPGKKLAEAAKNRNVLVYTDSNFSHLGCIWKTNLNETAKVPAFTNVYPELNHNEIAGFEKGKSDWIIFWLKDKISSGTDRKIKLAAKILRKRGIKSVEIPLMGKNKSEKTWNGIALSHWIAFYLAKANGVDLRKTKIIKQLKK